MILFVTWGSVNDGARGDGAGKGQDGARGEDRTLTGSRPRDIKTVLYNYSGKLQKAQIDIEQ
jgi:hypothetical protein